MTAAASAIAQSGKAASAYERMRSRTPREAQPSARVRTRQVGLKLGGFGFTYTAKDLELGNDAAAQQHLASLDPASLASQASQASAAPSRTQTPDTSAMTRKRGASAYASQLRRNMEDAVPRSVLLSVV